MHVTERNLTYGDLESDLAGKKFSPVYLFYGEEDFLAEEASRAVIEHALTADQREFNLDVMYGGETDAREIISHASSFPMMSDRRVVLVREMDRLSNKELLAGYIENPSSTTCLLLLSEKPDFRKKPYTSVRRHGQAFEFKPLYDNQVPEWIARRLKLRGRAIDGEASKILAAYTGTSLRDIQSEIDKLIIFSGDKKVITADDVREVVGMSKEFNVFELQKHIGTKNLGKSVEILDRMLDAGEPPVIIVASLTKYFASVWKLSGLVRKGASSQEQSRQAGIRPYFLKEYLAVLQRYSLQEIEHAFELLAAADEKIKTTMMDHKQILLMAIIQLVGEKDREPVSPVGGSMPR
jgi:DNA polymerase III subunit delta